MRISLKWLNEYLKIMPSPEDIAERLTMVGLEVESVEYLGEKYKNFVVGEITEVGKHPKADKLTVCSVNIGNQILQIVCGAPNVSKSQKVVVGLQGAIIPKDQHDPNGKPFTLSHVKLRGVDSYGMICSEYELDLGNDKGGILVLPDDAETGMPLADFLDLNDFVLEIGVTPNRPDALSHIGIAREIAAFLDQQFEIPAINIKESSVKITDRVKISVEDTKNCPRYTARLICGVRISESPKWMKDRLTAVGVRPVNNIVDITNYVLMECGHPLHAFDYDKLSDHIIRIRNAASGTSFTSLDHKERKLRSDTLMIEDSGSPIAIAGVIGGENTEIRDQTKNVLIESAYFNPESIRRTAKHFGVSTDASQRFGRGADPNITAWAVDRAAEMIASIAGGEILAGKYDIYPEKIIEKEIDVRLSKVKEILGLEISSKIITAMLEKISIKAIGMPSGDLMRFSVPTFRPDLEREIDLIEEIARCYGYDRIEVKTTTNVDLTNKVIVTGITDKLREIAVGCGWMEIVTNSMQNSVLCQPDSLDVVRISNPISQDMSALRTSMLHSMLGVIRNNINHANKNLRLFDLGKVYFKKNQADPAGDLSQFSEEPRIMFALTGSANPPNWDEKPRFVDFFDIKGEIETVLNKISLDNIKFIPYPNTDALNEAGISIEINNIRIGYLGKVSSGLVTSYGIEQEIYSAELSVAALESVSKSTRYFTGLPRYPNVVRDVALILDSGVQASEIESEIRFASGDLLKSVELFDLYIGDQIDPGKKSCAYTLTFLSGDHTLTNEEIEDQMKKIFVHLEKTLSANIRKKELSS